MKRTLLATSIALCLSSQAYAANVKVVPNVGLQIKQLSFEQDLTTFDFGDCDCFQEWSGELDVTMPVLQSGVTVIIDRWFTSVKLEKAIGEWEGDSTVPFTNDVLGGNDKNDTDVDRGDLILTAGYGINNNFSVFGGLMYGKTILTPKSSGFNLATNQKASGGDAYEQRYSEYGLFAGGSYTQAFEGAGALSFSLAYAILEGTYEDNYTAAVSDDFHYTGDASGLSVSASWAGKFTDVIGYYADIRTQTYKMDGDTDESGNFPRSSVETTETINSVTFGIRFSTN